MVVIVDGGRDCSQYQESIPSVVDAVHAYLIGAKMPWVEKGLLGTESWQLKVSFSNASEIQLHSLSTKGTWEMGKDKQDG